MFDLIWDIFQQGQIRMLKDRQSIHSAKLEGVEAHSDSAEARLHELEQRHEQLKLVTLAMWRLLKDHTGIMESDLRKYVETTDLLDGRADGKAAERTERTTCTGCDRTILNTAVVCAYCGTRQQKKNVFSGA